MADTRRANPAYQNDVDEMIFDYLLHHALKAHLELLELHFDQDGIEAENSEKKNAVARLLIVFNEFITLFKHNHSDYIFSAAQDFNIRLLAFIVLIAARCSVPDALRNDIRQSIDSLGHVYRSTIRPCRRAWVSRRYANVNNPDGVVDPREIQLLKIWSHITLPQRDTTNETPGLKAPLIYLLPDFMSLSATAVDSRQESINEKWMHLAAQFMLQAAISSLLPRCPSDTPQDAVPTEFLTLSPASEIIQEAFAYGFIPPLSAEDTATKNAPNEQDAIEEQINTMFQYSMEEIKTEMGIKPDPDVVELKPKQENQTWSRIRAEYMHLFDHHPGRWLEGTEASMTDFLNDLQSRYPLSKFEMEVLQFISSLWYLCGNGNENGLPVLVQIERGYLKGLNQEEFVGFMSRVGL